METLIKDIKNKITDVKHARHNLQYREAVPHLGEQELNRAPPKASS